MKIRTTLQIFILIFSVSGLTLCNSAQYKADQKQMNDKLGEYKNQLSNEKTNVLALQKEKEDLQKKFNTEKALNSELQKQMADLNKQLEAGKNKEKNNQKQLDDLKMMLDAGKKRELDYQKQLDNFNSLIAAEKAESEKKIRKNEETYKQLISSLKNEIQNDEVMINNYKDALTINIADRILFDTGKAEIKPEYYKLLDKVGSIIKNLPGKTIHIEGHTDDIPIATEYQWKIPNNWALGARRAINVSIYFIDKININPHKIGVMSFSKYRPLVPNTSVKNRAKNRRIEIVILDDSLYQQMEKKQGLSE